MFVVVTDAKQKCKNIKTLLCRYRSQATSWTGSSLFAEWIKDLDRKFVREGGKIIIIVDQGVIRSLYAHYRLPAVQKMILAVEMNKQ